MRDFGAVAGGSLGQFLFFLGAAEIIVSVMLQQLPILRVIAFALDPPGSTATEVPYQQSPIAHGEKTLESQMLMHLF